MLWCLPQKQPAQKEHNQKKRSEQSVRCIWIQTENHAHTSKKRYRHNNLLDNVICYFDEELSLHVSENKALRSIRIN